jgi:hypothetical protein
MPNEVASGRARAANPMPWDVNHTNNWKSLVVGLAKRPYNRKGAGAKGVFLDQLVLLDRFVDGNETIGKAVGYIDLRGEGVLLTNCKKLEVLLQRSISGVRELLKSVGAREMGGRKDLVKARFAAGEARDWVVRHAVLSRVGIGKQEDLRPATTATDPAAPSVPPARAGAGAVEGFDEQALPIMYEHTGSLEEFPFACEEYWDAPFESGWDRDLLW